MQSGVLFPKVQAPRHFPGEDMGYPIGLTIMHSSPGSHLFQGPRTEFPALRQGHDTFKGLDGNVREKGWWREKSREAGSVIPGADSTLPCLCVREARGAWGISEPDSHQVSRKQHTIRGSVLSDRPVTQKKQITQISAWLLLIFFLMSITISPCGATRNETFLQDRSVLWTTCLTPTLNAQARGAMHWLLKPGEANPHSKQLEGGW